VSKRPPRTVATIDCETDPFLFGRVPLPFLWDLFDGSRHYTFELVTDVLAFLEGKDWIIYAHNGGKFDYHMPGFLDSLEPWAKVMIINGRLAKFKIGECEFRDSYNILPVPLAAYKKDEIDYTKFEKSERHKHMAEITRYLHKDTEYLRELVVRFRDQYGNGLTLAGSAMKVWQERSRRTAPQSTRGFYHEISPYYYGGRVECCETGPVHFPTTLIDINSAYPYAMLHQHPISTQASVVVPNKNDAIRTDSFYSVAARSAGAFPIRLRTGTVFPNDETRRVFHVTGWELLAAIETKTAQIDRIVKRYDFAETIDFKGYVHHFYDIKKSAAKGSPEYIFAKLFMNSLYGKFGANPEEYTNNTICDPRFIKEACNDGYDFAGELGPWAVLSSPLEGPQERFYNVATAASITGFVRAYLWRHMCMLRRGGCRVLYCDTDSIIYGGKAPRTLALGKELGQWNEEARFTMGGIAGKKLYAFQKPDGGWKTGCKGAKLDGPTILRVAEGAEVTYERDAPTYGANRKPSFVKRRIRATAGGK
jgi:hypothetical protein